MDADCSTKERGLRSIEKNRRVGVVNFDWRSPKIRCSLRSHFPCYSLNLIIVRPAVIYGVGAPSGISKQKLDQIQTYQNVY